MRKLITACCVLILLVAACSGEGGDDVASAPTATLAPLLSLTPRLTATPVSTRTPLPTFTPVPSDTPVPPTPSDTPTPTERPPIIGIIQSLESVNVREGPDVSYSAIRALVPGTGVEVLGQNQDGSWYNILMEDNTQGWVFGNLVFIEQTPTPLPTFTLTPDLTSVALGTPLPTALIGGGTVTPTPPNALTTATPPELLEQDEPEITEEAGPTESFLPIIVDAGINQTATALAAQVGGAASPPPVTGQSPNVQNTTEAEDDNTVRMLSPTPGGVSTAEAVPPTPTPRPSGNATVQDGVDVFAMCDNPVFGVPAPTDIAAGSTIDVFWAWYVADPSYVQQHVDAVNYEVRVNGERLNDWQQYGQRTVPVGDSYAKYWYVPYGPLSAGEYTITYRATWSEAIRDGYESFGPGTNNPVEEGTCTFTVS